MIETARDIGRLLLERGHRLFVFETAAGGGISSKLVAVDGASMWYEGGAVAYSSSVKDRYVALPPSWTGGVVSESYALEAAQQLLAGDPGISVALVETSMVSRKPTTRSSKPAGLSCVAVAFRSGYSATDTMNVLRATREETMEGIVEWALRTLMYSLSREGVQNGQ